MKGRGLLIAGTASDAGKTVITAGICRWLYRRGVRVAPFKAQNMSNNSVVAVSGGDGSSLVGEMARAQAMQAEACGLAPDIRFNPILLKPESDKRSQLVVRGEVVGFTHANDFAGQRADLRQIALTTLEELRNEFEVVVCEGAGSPAEINLRTGDLSNMGLAEPAGLPTVIVGDINRGGVFAGFYGTLALLDPRDQALVSAFIINKFRGDEGILKPGIETLTRLTGRPTLGIVPWQLDVWLDSEDRVPYGLVRPAQSDEPSWLHIVVVRLPNTSNATDVDALVGEPGVRVLFTADVHDLVNADLVVIPGTKTTVNDLGWLIQRGFAEALQIHVGAGKPLIGLCGGFQMLCERIDDPVESGYTNVKGLGFLPFRVAFDAVKKVRRFSGVAFGEPVSGYEIHHGYITDSSPEVRSLITLEDGTHEGAISARGNVFGTHLHGIFESDQFRRAFLRDVARLARKGSAPDAPKVHFASTRQRMVDLFGDMVEEHIDTDALWRIIEQGASSALPILKHTLLRTGGDASGPSHHLTNHN